MRSTQVTLVVREVPEPQCCTQGTKRNAPRIDRHQTWEQRTRSITTGNKRRFPTDTQPAEEVILCSVRSVSSCLRVTEEATVRVMRAVWLMCCRHSQNSCSAVNRLGCHQKLRCQMSCQRCSTAGCELMRHGCFNTRPTSPSPN